jgi:hypothetical protein
MKEKTQKASLLKRFLMTLAATTVSIVLTFGTTAIIDRKKQKDAKREMVMMILYDMHESLEAVEQCDANLKSFFDTQLDVVAHPQKMDVLYAPLAANIPTLDYTTTMESIFKSNIETIQTIGNILFVETVSSFYDNREHYKEEVVDAFLPHAYKAAQYYESLRDLETPTFLFVSDSRLRLMRGDYGQCMQMMKVTDDDLLAFMKRQQKLREATREDDNEKVIESALEQNRRKSELQNAREAGAKELE